MTLINRNTDYALRSLCMMASRKGGGRVSVTDVVERLGIPRPFMRRILQALHRAGILVAFKGKGGGFCLTRSAERIRVTDVMEVFQGPLKINECSFKKKACPRKRACRLKKKIDSIERRVIAELGAITVRSLVG